MKNKPEAKRTRVVTPLYELKVFHAMTLLEFLLEKLPSLSRNNIKSLLSRKQVAINGAIVSQFDFMLAKDDEIAIMKKPQHVAKAVAKSLDILYEDDELIVINKPSGLLTIASDKEKGMTVYRLLMDYVRQNNKHARVFIVHRIDRDTSGVLMVAKNEQIRDILQDKWNDIVSKRGYYAIVEGKMEKETGTIKSWLRETRTNLMYSSYKPGDGQEAITHYQVMKCNGTYSLLDVRIDSGRKNQIRVHMKDLGHLIIGDEKYGSTDMSLERLGLHAYALEFTHPVKNKKMRFKATIPNEFESFIKVDHTKKKDLTNKKNN